MQNLTFFIFLAFLKCANSHIVMKHVKLPEINVTGENVTSHLNYANVKKICNNRFVCSSNNTNICGVRRINNDFEYRDFENSCYLFLSNMCDYPGEEFSIAQSGNCTSYLKTRRMYVYSGVGDTTTIETVTEGTTLAGAPDLHAGTFSTLYEVETAYDFHICPLRCPDTYSPECVTANRGFGKYFKFWTFINHCAGDLYYCKHWEDFSPPDGEDEAVSHSKLSWSYCGAHRYLQFARFAETASAMGHFGWLEGGYRYSRIMEPHMRRPGYG